MQDTFLQLFIVALGLIMCPNNDPRIEERDDGLIAGMQEREQNLLREEDKLNQEITPSGPFVLQDENYAKMIHSDTSLLDNDLQKYLHENEHYKMDYGLPQKFKIEAEGDDLQEPGLQTTEIQEAQTYTKKASSKTAETERDYILFIWKTFSIVSFFHFFWKTGKRISPKLKEIDSFLVINMPKNIQLMDSKTLQSFHSQCVASSKNIREEEFLEGFINDLLESMKKVCDENGGMEIENADLDDLHNISVPLVPPEECFFKCLLSNHADDVLPFMQMCGQIQLMKKEQIQNGCPCQASDAAGDMVCLLHRDKVETKISKGFYKHLCKKDLSKAEVGSWFQSTIRQAWSLISFKYDFEISICNSNISGALIVRFRSGEKMCFSINPVIKFHHDCHFFIAPCSPKSLDTFWSLSLSKYEDAFLNEISKKFPKNSCHLQTLEIAQFLHRKQTMLTGSSALKDLHFKTALMHLVLIKDPSDWRPDFVAKRIQDIFAFMMKSIKTKQLHHILIGNPLAQDVIQLPTELIQSNPVNLFHPLVVHECIYKNAVLHFQELLKNAQMVINDYLNKRLH